MRFAGLTPLGRIATRVATWGAPPYTARRYLARLSPRGYVDPAASIHHGDLRLGEHVFIADRVVIHQEKGGGSVELGDRVHLYRDCIVVTGDGGSVTIGPDTHIQPRSQVMGFTGSIRIGRGVQVAPNCAMYSYDHGFAPGEAIRRQPLSTRGGIVIDDEAWLGVGVIVLDGVSIGRGAVVGAGSVVTRDVPEGAIAVGVPARVLRRRADLSPRVERPEVGT
ncbi:MAG: acyltransferase [bacterium]